MSVGCSMLPIINSSRNFGRSVTNYSVDCARTLFRTAEWAKAGPGRGWARHSPLVPRHFCRMPDTPLSRRCGRSGDSAEFAGRTVWRSGKARPPGRPKLPRIIVSGLPHEQLQPTPQGFRRRRRSGRRQGAGRAFHRGRRLRRYLLRRVPRPGRDPRHGRENLLARRPGIPLGVPQSGGERGDRLRLVAVQLHQHNEAQQRQALRLRGRRRFPSARRV